MKRVLPKYIHYFLSALTFEIVTLLFGGFLISKSFHVFSLCALFLVISWIFVNLLTYPRTNQRYVSFTQTYYRLSKVFFLSFLLFYLLVRFVIDCPYVYENYGKFLLLEFLLLVVNKFTFILAFRWYRQLNMGISNYMILAKQRDAVFFRRVLKHHRQGGYVFCCATDEHNPLITYQRLEELSKALKSRYVDEIYIYPTNSRNAFEFMQKVGKRINANVFLIPLDTIKHVQLTNFRLINDCTYDEIILGPLTKKLHQVKKRFFDIVFALAVILLLLSWLLPILGILICLDSKGSMFFIQPRAGRDGTPFNCIKLRTMKTNVEAHTVQATRKDPRITKFGAFLRKTSLDELPQFINVLLGDMSIVGPRPHIESLNKKFEPIIEQYNSRFAVKPGITGLSQAYGYRGETNTNRSMEIRVKTDLVYIQNWTMLLDIRIILRTIRTTLLISDNNAY